MAIYNNWLDLESIMLSEMSDGKRQILYDFTLMWNIKQKKQQTKQIHRH